MQLNEFRRYYRRELEAWHINEKYYMFKPFKLWNEETNEEVKFKRLDDALDHMIDGVSIRDHIEALPDPKDINYSLDGGRGSGSGKNTYDFSWANSSEPRNSTKVLPAHMNTLTHFKGGEQSLNGAITAFRSKYGGANREYSSTVDSQGFSHGAMRGGRSSVGASGDLTNKVLIHNHPSGGNFSGQDLITTATTRARGVVAVNRTGHYSFEKTHKFKAENFLKGMGTAKIRGDDYSSAVDQWLNRNQKRYGYKYTNYKG